MLYMHVIFPIIVTLKSAFGRFPVGANNAVLPPPPLDMVCPSTNRVQAQTAGCIVASQWRKPLERLMRVAEGGGWGAHSSMAVATPRETLMGTPTPAAASVPGAALS